MRVKDARTWILTYSPQDDVENVPKEIQAFFESDGCTKVFAVAEYANKWHIHAGFITSREFNSDYKWWKGFEQFGYKAPALDIKYHNNILGLVGGYCTKSDAKVLYNKGFTNEELAEGRKQYTEGKQKQSIRKFLDKHTVVSRDKYEVAIGAAMHEFNCTRAEASIRLAKIGFAFSTSEKGLEELYRDKYRKEDEMSIM